MAWVPERPQRRSEALLRELDREPVEAAGVRHRAKLGRVVGRILERRDRAGCVAAHDRGGQASNAPGLFEAPVVDQMDDTGCERR